MRHPDAVVYEEGTVRGNLPHAVQFNLGNIDPLKGIGLSRFVEFWLQRHCRGQWRVVLTDQSLSVKFSRDLDLVIFKLSDEYCRFAQNNRVMNFLN